MKGRERVRIEERCELCEKKAMVHCDADKANLCWSCDKTVHSDNFLVEKHTRILLCSICNSHTQWKACGPKLIPPTSLCHRCMPNDDGESDSEEENQVVPVYTPLSPDSAASALNTQPDTFLSNHSRAEETGCSPSSEMHSAALTLIRDDIVQK